MSHDEIQGTTVVRKVHHSKHMTFNISSQLCISCAILLHTNVHCTLCTSHVKNNKFENL